MAKKAKIEEPQETDAPVKPKRKVGRKSVKKPAVDAEPIAAKKPTRTNTGSKTTKKTVEVKVIPKPKPRPHATRPTPVELIKIKERQTLVSDLRKAGATIRQISEHLKQKGYEHSSPATVFADLEANLTDINATRLTSTELLATQELDKIDDWEFSFYPELKSKKLSIDERIKIGNFFVTLQNQRDKYLRITKPQTIRLLNDEEFARAMGLNPEQLPDDDEG